MVPDVILKVISKLRFKVFFPKRRLLIFPVFKRYTYFSIQEKDIKEYTHAGLPMSCIVVLCKAQNSNGRISFGQILSAKLYNGPFDVLIFHGDSHCTVVSSFSYEFTDDPFVCKIGHI